jgi:regulator of nonsense transcripts 1
MLKNHRFFIILLILFVIGSVIYLYYDYKKNKTIEISDIEIKNSPLVYNEIPVVFSNLKEYSSSFLPALEVEYRYILNTRSVKNTDIHLYIKNTEDTYNSYRNAILKFSNRQNKLSNEMLNKLLNPEQPQNLEYFALSPNILNAVNIQKLKVQPDLLEMEEKELLESTQLPPLVPINRPNIPNIFNASQLQAIEYAVTNSLTLIQGPPGTGKTKTSIEIIRRIYNENEDINDKILLCASSNNAVNQLVMKCNQLDIPVLRIFSKSAIIPEVLLNNSLDYLVEEYSATLRDKTLYNYIQYKKKELEKKKLQQKDLDIEKDNYVQMPADFYILNNEAEKEIVKKYKIIATTCTKSDHFALENITFNTILIDECAQMIEPEAIIPINKGSSELRLILVGDQQQLEPTIKSPLAKSLSLNCSLFERLILAIEQIQNEGKLPSIEKQFLNEQYRMHPDIAAFSSLQFYTPPGLANGPNTLWLPPNMFTFWNANTFNKPILFWDNTSYESGNQKDGYYNIDEVQKVDILVKILLENNVNSKDIGIITPYKRQIDELNAVINNDIEEENKIEINTVDSYQGREKDYILFSTVRSNSGIIEGKEDNPMGFVKDPKRLNVAITRAKYGMFIVGNAEFLAKYDEVWNALVTFYKNNRCLRRYIQ